MEEGEGRGGTLPTAGSGGGWKAGGLSSAESFWNSRAGYRGEVSVHRRSSRAQHHFRCSLTKRHCSDLITRTHQTDPTGGCSSKSPTSVFQYQDHGMQLKPEALSDPGDVTVNVAPGLSLVQEGH